LQETGSLSVKVAVDPVKQVEQWRLVSGDGTDVDLDLDKPLFVRVAEITSTPAGGHHHHHHPSSAPPVIPPASGSSGGTGAAPPPVPEPGIGFAILAGLGLLTLRGRR
jgi:hypothetical protein